MVRDEQEPVLHVRMLFILCEEAEKVEGGGRRRVNLAAVPSSVFSGSDCAAVCLSSLLV